MRNGDFWQNEKHNEETNNVLQLTVFTEGQIEANLSLNYSSFSHNPGQRRIVLVFVFLGLCPGSRGVPYESSGSSHGTLHDSWHGADHVQRTAANQHQQQSQIELPGRSQGEDNINNEVFLLNFCLQYALHSDFRADV